MNGARLASAMLAVAAAYLPDPTGLRVARLIAHHRDGYLGLALTDESGFCDGAMDAMRHAELRVMGQPGA